MRAIWTGSLSFGLVNIPIKLYSGSDYRSSIDLTMLHEKDNSPIRYAKVCRAEGNEVPYEEIVKGYEYRDGDYIILTEEDFERANPRKTKTIDIMQFSEEEEIDSRYFEKPYYLEPNKGAEKPYALLREALKRSQKVAVATFVLRKREHLAVVKPDGDALVLNQLRYAEELRSYEPLNLPSAETADDRQVDMALQLIDQLSQSFEPEQFKDTYTQELHQVIEEKAQGEETVPAAAEEPEDVRSRDLMEALRGSLQREREREKAAK